MELDESMINAAAKKVYEIPFKSTAQYVSERENLVKQMAETLKVKPEVLMKAVRSVMPTRIGEEIFHGATKEAIAAKAAPMETPYGKSFLSYTPEGKVAGMAGKVLRGATKVAGPVGAALTAAELGGALSEVRKLGAEKIAAENEAKQGYSSEERLKLKEMLKKLKGNPALRE